MPLYGQTFTLYDSGDYGLNARSTGPGEAGPFTRAGGFLAFYEVNFKIYMCLVLDCHIYTEYIYRVILISYICFSL